jgi:glycosyltransferase involved in cell wall biosynthesis
LENCWAGKIDLCIGLKFPAYFIPHSNKVIWALHQYRAAYDLFDSQYSGLKNDLRGNEIKTVITNADNHYLTEAQRLFTISVNVAARMRQYNHIQAQPLYHPCPQMETFYAGAYGDYILMPSRINLTKRQKLAVEAMALSKSDIKLYIMGKADNPYESDVLRGMIKELKLQNRIKLFDYVSHEEKLKLYADAKAILFIPFDEDYGYITLEAMSASKAVITAADSGGSLEFIENGKTGLIADPTAESIAKAMDELAESRTLAETLGQAAKRHLAEMNITWAHVVKELTKP